MKKVQLIFILIALSTNLFSQRISFQNPSFEQVDSVVKTYKYRDNESKPPKKGAITTTLYTHSSWKSCGFSGETPPDVHPTNQFGVTKLAADGRFYLGMVARDNGTWESIGQKLSTPLSPDTCYQIRLHLMNSAIYQSMSRQTGNTANYDRPVRLRIWGARKACGMHALLTVSEPIENREWQTYQFVLKPDSSYAFLRFEAFYTEGSLFYNGNILMDGLSDLVPCPCGFK
jgi:hypothetical protein